MDSAVVDTPAVLVRVPMATRRPLRRLPRTPAGTGLTVTATTAPSRAGTAALEQRGYRLAGVVRSDRTHALDVLVPKDVADAHPRWFRRLLRRASHVFDCQLGPVQLLLRDELALHGHARSTRPDGHRDSEQAPRP